MTADPWVLAHTSGAPEALRRRVLEWIGRSPHQTGVSEAPSSEGSGPPETLLAGAAVAALQAALGAPPNRAVALDLLAADALVTLALLARAERDPQTLAAWARRLRDAGAACR